ncbi:MAG: amino acid adenylation domain-containing protein [Pseudomonadota bacterium]|nr:amino acid adenylation domain-containing protein [Pseudomonadota bacterium]
MNPSSNPEINDERYEFPAAFGQEQLWYLHEIAPESSAYNIAYAFELAGDLDVGALEEAFPRLIQRHDALRTGFAVVDEQLRQIVRAAVDFRLDITDLGALAPEASEKALAGMKQQCARRRFDLSEAPLLWAHLARMSSDRHVLLMCIHHIVVDHLSVLQLGAELQDFYGVAHGPVSQPVPTSGWSDDERLQFADYVVWQREQMSDDVIARKVDHWVSVVGPSPQMLALPTDRPRPASQTFCGDELPVYLPHALGCALRAQAQKQKQSLFVLMLSALSLVLHKYSGQRELMVGCPMANRPGEELHDVVGLFMNVLPVRVQVDSAARFDQLAQQVRRQVTNALAHQDTPFERIVRAVRCDDRASRNPLVQVGFTFQDPPLALDLPDLQVRSEALHNGGSKFDLNLWFWDDGSDVAGLIEYNTDLFDAQTVSRFSDHLLEVLRQAVAAPCTPVADFSLVSSHERAMTRSCAEETACEGVLTSMHEAFFQRAAELPLGIVLMHAKGELSAGELAARADSIAWRLQRSGILPGDIVAVCLERGEALLPSLLAVLRCGAAYLPLDPSLPGERIAYMLRDSGARLVLVEAATRSALPQSDVPLLSADAEHEGPESAAFVPHVPRPEDIAYVMYTSGSTGRPKGVCIPHRAVGNFLSAMRERPGIDKDDVLLALTMYAFDISVLELFLPLSFGARVQLVDRSAVADGEALRRLIDTGPATMIQATPSTWHLLRGAGWKGKVGLKALIGGEPLPPTLAKWLLPRVRELWNMYGPTETTVWSTCAKIDDRNVEQCPIGTPVVNTIVEIVDENLRVLPPGIAGELVIGGKGIAAGYLEREQLTRERFIVLEETGDKVYRTGDRAIWRNGQLHHLGRDDDQVKIRGFRIELGEVESVLATLPEVESAAARVWPTEEGDSRIHAYYCTRSGGELPQSRLREHARSFLPAYMLPQVFVHLSAIPLLPNGKIDRNALPERNDPIARGTVPASDEGLSPNESMLLSVCRDLIGNEAVALDDNFFDAGGHSLLALTLISRIESQTGVRLPILKIARSSLRTLSVELVDSVDRQPVDDTGLAGRLNRWVRATVGGARSGAFP